MKKSLVLMAMAGVALAGCVNDVAEVAQNQEEKKMKIGFEALANFSNIETRAKYYGEIDPVTSQTDQRTTTYPQAEDFVIYAVQHSGDFKGWSTSTTDPGFNGFTLSYNSYEENGQMKGIDAWVPLKAPSEADRFFYWPGGIDKLSFAASSPADLEQTECDRNYGSSGLTLDDFVVPISDGIYYKQFDLLFSRRSINCTVDNMLLGSEHYSGIPIVFKHALSSIRFSFMKEDIDEAVSLTSIELKNIINKGDFSEGITTENTESGYYIYEDNDHTPTWTVDNSSTADYVAFRGNALFPEDIRYVSAIADETDFCHPLLLLPQTLSDDAVLVVNYMNGNIPANPVTIPLNQLLVKTWEIGTRYTYRLVIDKETVDKDKIYFSPSTDSWQNNAAVVINLSDYD